MFESKVPALNSLFKLAEAAEEEGGQAKSSLANSWHSAW